MGVAVNPSPQLPGWGQTAPHGEGDGDTGLGQWETCYWKRMKYL